MNGFDYHRTVLAYHGCDASIADRVLGGELPLKKSENDYDWLGKGIYFWEHGPRRAWEWAKIRSSQNSKTIRNPAVVGAVIHLGICFDLLDTENTRILSEIFPEFEKATAKSGRKMPENQNRGSDTSEDLVLRQLDCAVVNWTLELLEKEGLSYDTVRCVFSEGEAAFSGSKILSKSHIQIAVRNPKAIVGFFRPAIDFTKL